MLKTANTSIDKTGTSDSGNPGTSNNPGGYKEIDADPRRWVDALPLRPHAIKLGIMAESWLSHGRA